MAVMDQISTAVAVDGSTISQAYLQRIGLGDEQRAYLVKKGGQYVPVPWKEIHANVLALYGAYRKLGLAAGDRIAILAQTCPRWNIVDLSSITSGFITVPIYASNTVEDVAYILKNSGAKVLFLDAPEQLEKSARALRSIGKTIPIVALGDESLQVGGATAVAFGDFALAAGEDVRRAWENAARSVQPEDTASIVYTSGTTGVPKGVVLTHSNFSSGLRAVIDEVELTGEDMLLTFLPFAHIFGRIESIAPVFAGITMGFAENISTVAGDLQLVRPTVLVSVPRIYEKIYAKITADVAAGSPIKQNIFRWAESVGRQYVRLLSEKEPIPLALRLKYSVADQLVFSKIRAKLGGRIKLTASGGAPLARDICEFFHACGVKILEGYGLTETLGPIFVNHPDNYRFGTVGTPLDGAEVKIAADGEILLKGPMVFKEYYQNPEATKEAFTADGWFKSGDIGEIDAQGFLKITDRKKELIVTAGGKNIAPQKLENLMKLSPYISNCMAFGDKKKYIVALVTLNPDNIKKWCEENGLSGKPMSEVVEHPELIELIDGELAKANKQLASYESIKKVTVLPEDWTPESGELTPSLKIKRKVIVERYGDKIEAMYR